MFESFLRASGPLYSNLPEVNAPFLLSTALKSAEAEAEAEGGSDRTALAEQEAKASLLKALQRLAKVEQQEFEDKQ